MSHQMNCGISRSATSSPGSASGLSPCGGPDGQMTALCGPDPALASLSARQAKEMGLLMSGTSGRTGITSSESAALASSLASRLQIRTALLGSTLFTLTWKERATPSGLLISALRASGRRISVNDSGSWPTPTASNTKTAYQDAEKVIARKEAGRQSNLQDFACLAGWGTPTKPEAGRTPEQFLARKEALNGACGVSLTALNLQATLAGWITPTTRDWKDTPGMTAQRDGKDRADQLPRQAYLAGWPTPNATLVDAKPKPPITRGRKPTDPQIGLADVAVHLAASPIRLTATGEMLTGCSAEMESGGQLNPAHARVGRLRAYGNAINARQAEAFITAYLESE